MLKPDDCNNISDTFRHWIPLFSQRCIMVAKRKPMANEQALGAEPSRSRWAVRGVSQQVEFPKRGASWEAVAGQIHPDPSPVGSRCCHHLAGLAVSLSRLSSYDISYGSIKKCEQSRITRSIPSSEVVMSAVGFPGPSSFF